MKCYEISETKLSDGISVSTKEMAAELPYGTDEIDNKETNKPIGKYNFDKTHCNKFENLFARSKQNKNWKVRNSKRRFGEYFD